MGTKAACLQGTYGFNRLCGISIFCDGSGLDSSASKDGLWASDGLFSDVPVFDLFGFG